MDIARFKPKTKRASGKRVGRGGKRGTTAGAGTKGQKSRAGKGIKPGFRGGDNRIWQLFPKLRGSSSRAGSKRPHHKHRYARFPKTPYLPLNLNKLNAFHDGDTVNPGTLAAKGLVTTGVPIKILGTGELTKKLSFEDLAFSASARAAIEKVGGTIQ